MESKKTEFKYISNVERSRDVDHKDKIQVEIAHQLKRIADSLESK